MLLRSNTLRRCVVAIFASLTFVAFSFGQLGRVSFLNQSLNVYLYEFFLVLSFLYFLFKYGFFPFFSFIKRLPLVLYFFLYLFFTFFFKISSFNFLQNVVAFFYFLRLLFYFSYLAFFIHHLQINKLNGKSVKTGLLLCYGLVIIFSLIQYFYYPDLRNLFYLGWDPHLYRVFGTFLEPAVLAALLAIFFMMLIFFPSLVKNKFLKSSLLAVTFILIVLTFSRGVYVALLVTLTFYFARKNAKYIFLVLAFFIMLILVLPKPLGEGVRLTRTSTINSRLHDYSKGFDIWKKDPVLGVGYNRIRYVKKEYDSHAGASFHSSLLTILVAGGGIGLLIYLGVLIKLAQINTFSFYNILFLSIASLFDNLLLHPFVLFLYFTSLAYSSTHLSDKKQ